MLTTDQLAALRGRLTDDPDLQALRTTLRQRTAGLLHQEIHVPRVKALLSRDGGFCPTDGATLLFDPWSPDRHRCPRCGESFGGERHHRHWARAQHLWLAERLGDLALLVAIDGNQEASHIADQLIGEYSTVYFELPNRDNVLGPTHLFFSTYLESVWITSFLAAACHLRAAGVLTAEREEGVSRIADEAATLIAEFNEGLSNRQTWHAAALAAIAVWFDDVELARVAVESPTGLVAHLADGFGSDGLWYEGENYHLFALRGLMQGMQWAHAIGYDLLDDPVVRDHFRAALLGPTRSALPDFTYPARRDARYGVSLAQPASLDLWEIGRAWLGGDLLVESWLAALYAVPLPLPPADHVDYWLHDAGLPPRTERQRSDLSAWAMLSMLPAASAPAPWHPRSVLLEGQGLAVLRAGERYASLECGAAIGGHGHPDRLHLSVHAGDAHWLPDQGTGSYVHPDLAWYRSALAHNAPIIDGVNAGGADALCEAFATDDLISWCRGVAGEVSRAVVHVPGHLIDVVSVDAPADREVVLPWHLQGEIEIMSPGQWEPATIDHPFVSTAERFIAATPGNLVVQVRAANDRMLRIHLMAGDAELLRAMAPGLPTEVMARSFLLLRGQGRTMRWIAVLDFEDRESERAVTTVRSDETRIIIGNGTGETGYQLSSAGLTVAAPGGRTALPGTRPRRAVPLQRPKAERSSARGYAPRIGRPPALDGTLEGFDRSAPLELGLESQYRRSEEPYDADHFAARAWINWDGDALYLTVTVRKPALVFRAENAAPLLLDNEQDDIHSDGLQLYWADRHGADPAGALVTPRPDGRVGVRVLGQREVSVQGAWLETNQGYRVTLRINDALVLHREPVGEIRFELLVNEMQPGRDRRAGQLAWSSGGGWVYLRGDRQPIDAVGVLIFGE